MRALGLTIAMAVMGGAAAAAPITFDLTNPGKGKQASALSGSKDGVDVTVTGDTFDGATFEGTGSYLVGYWSSGLGYYNSSSDGSHQVEGKGLDDVLLFEFSETVRLESVRFSYLDGNDDFVLFVDGAREGKFDISGSATDVVGDGDNDGDDRGTFNFASLFTGTVFGIGAEDKGDNFKISSITVSKIDLPGVSAVPLPAGGLLLLSALGALAARRRG